MSTTAITLGIHASKLWNTDAIIPYKKVRMSWNWINYILSKTAEFDNSVIPFQTTPISHEPLKTLLNK